MKTSSIAFAVSAFTLILTSGCGGQKDRAGDFLSAQDNAPTAEQGLVMQREVENYVYQQPIADILPALYNGTMHTLLHSAHEQQFYDEQNRLTLLQINNYPGLNVQLEGQSVIPEEGITTFEVVYKYEGAVPWQTSEVAYKIWRFGEGSTGKISLEASLINNWEEAEITSNIETYTSYYYDENNALDNIDIYTTINTYQLNSNGYRLATYSNDLSTSDQEMLTSQMERMDGINMDTLTLKNSYYPIQTYLYGAAGELLEYSAYDRDNKLREHNNYQYLVINDVHYRINDQTYFNYDIDGNPVLPEGKGTRLSVYTLATCDLGNLYRLKSEQPEWFKCQPTNAW